MCSPYHPYKYNSKLDEISIITNTRDTFNNNNYNHNISYRYNPNICRERREETL